MAVSASDGKYGPQTAEIQALIEQIKTTTIEQATALAKAYRNSLRYEFARALDAAKEAEDSADRYVLREAAWYSAGKAARDAVWTAKQDTNWRATLFSIRDAVWALVVKDLITAEEFKILCEPWVSVMDKQVDEQQQVPVANETPTTEAQPNSDGDDVAANLRKEVAYRDATIQGLIAALEIKNQQLATAERKSRRWKERAEKAKAKLAKFHPCYDSNGCYGELDSVHIVDADGDSFTDNYGGERMRTVWHKDGE